MASTDVNKVLAEGFDVSKVEPIEGLSSVYAGQLLSDDYCSLLIKQLHAFHDEDRLKEKGVDLHLPEYEMGHVWEHITATLMPLLQQLADEKAVGVTPRFVSAIAVRYDTEGHKRIGVHIDDNDLTVNICLNELFEGGQVVFETEKLTGEDISDFGSLVIGNQDADLPEGWSENRKSYVVTHSKGRALIHHGDVLHTTTPMREGVRFGLVIKYDYSTFTLFSDLPTEIQFTILQNCRPATLANVMAASKTLNEYANEDFVWHAVYAADPITSEYVPTEELEGRDPESWDADKKKRAEEMRDHATTTDAVLAPTCDGDLISLSNGWKEAYRLCRWAKKEEARRLALLRRRRNRVKTGTYALPRREMAKTGRFARAPEFGRRRRVTTGIYVVNPDTLADVGDKGKL